MYKDPAIIQVKATRDIPPPGKPHGIALPGTSQPGRTPIYRHWRYVDGLMETIDPNVSFFPFLSYRDFFLYFVFEGKEQKQ